MLLYKTNNNFSRFTNESGILTEGTGLGLPISKHFTELMGGEILVESEPVDLKNVKKPIGPDFIKLRGCTYKK